MLTHKRHLLKTAVVAFLSVSVLGGMLIAQSRKQRGPRAIGVVEITPKGRARLVPIGILVDGKWYDAGIYMANPRPMALEPETVYEAEKTGTPQGFFTVSAAQELGGSWVGVGTWKPSTGEQAAPKKPENEKPQSANPEDDDAPPVLRRPGAAKPGSTTTAAQPASTPPATPAGESQEKRAAEEAKAAQSSRNEEPEDPNRPVLRRGKPAQEQTGELDVATGTPDKIASSKGATATPILVDTYAAISDANPGESRSFSLSLNPAEREEYARKMMEFASAAIRKFAVTHPIRGRQAPNVALVDIQTRDFDVNGSNDPVLVLSARAPEVPAAATPPMTSAPRQRTAARGAKAAQTPTPPTASPTPTQQTAPPPGAGFEYYVTVVARVDVNGEVRKLFESVTDTSHLDAIPRLQLIDCVDADGNRVGELLFREVYDRSRTYAIYRVGMDKLWEVFQTSQVSSGR